MADFPEHSKNARAPRPGNLTVDPPEVDANEDGEKTPEQLRVEQQWRDVEDLGIAQDHPLSINRDADEVTSDPYDQP